MARPRVRVSVLNGGLQQQGPTSFGDSAVLVASPAAPAAGYGVAFLVKSKKQINTALSQVANAEVAAALRVFYDEAPEGTKLYVMCMAQTTTLATLMASANADKVLNAGAGAVRLLGAIKFPAGGYVPTITGGLDADVHAAVSAAQTLAEGWLAQNKPFRAIIEGYAYLNAASLQDYATATNDNVACFIGSVNGSTARATMLALGRAAKLQSHVNIGRVKSGSLNLADADVVRIGNTLVDQVASVDLDTIHEKRYMTFERNENAPGFIISDDVMLTSPTSDYSSLANGRVIDNAVRVAYRTYYRELKDDVDVDENGRIAIENEKALENAIELAIASQMPGQLSANQDGTPAVTAVVNPSPDEFPQLYEDNNIPTPNLNLLQTGSIYIFIRMRPKGYLRDISLFLGYSVDAA